MHHYLEKYDWMGVTKVNCPSLAQSVSVTRLPASKIREQFRLWTMIRPQDFQKALPFIVKGGLLLIALVSVTYGTLMHGTVSFLLVAVSFHTLVFIVYADDIGKDLVEHCKNDDKKEAICKILENVGITSALVLTTIAGVLTTKMEKAAGHDKDDVFQEALAAWGNLTDTSNLAAIVATRYGAVGVLGLISSFAAVVLSVVNHFYLSSLTPTLAAEWLTEHPTAVGETVLYMGESYYYFAFTIVIWCRFAYGNKFSFMALLMFLLVTANISCRCVWLSSFRPTEKGTEAKKDQQGKDGGEPTEKSYLLAQPKKAPTPPKRPSRTSQSGLPGP